MRETLRSSRRLRKLLRWYRALRTAYPRWQQLLGDDRVRFRELLEAPRGRANSGARRPRVLIATSLGGYWPGTTLDSLLAIALTIRDADVDVLLCDGVLSACQQCEIRAHRSAHDFARGGPRVEHCRTCRDPGRRFFESLGIRVLSYGDFIDESESARIEATATAEPAASIAAYLERDIAVGEHALAGTLRFFARGDLDDEPAGEAVLRRYFRAALTTECVVRRVLETGDYDRVIAHHGIYVPQGIIVAVAQQLGVGVVTWTPAYRKRCFFFSHDGTYHHTMLSEPSDSWLEMPWSADHERELLAYLKSRWQGTDDWIWFHNRPRESWSAIERELGIDAERPLIGLLTNVIWDAQLHYPANAFRNMMEWVVESVRYFERHPQLQLVIRVHPAEIRGTLPSRQRVVAELARAFPTLPSNVAIVPPESEVSTYALLERCNAALIYGTKTGVELAATGKPVIVAGEAWVRGKGFTFDASDRDSYFALLDRLPLPELTGDLLEHARRYAYHVFFRRMVPLEFMSPTGADPPYTIDIDGLAPLEPGASPGLDVICRGILEGEPFHYPAEDIGWIPAAVPS